MTNEFPAFSRIVNKSLQTLVTAGKVFEVEIVGGVDEKGEVIINGEALYKEYLAAFPVGTDPIFKNRTEHDCSCCKQFIRRTGLIVAINGNATDVKTIWDEAAEKAPHPYNIVAAALRDKVKNGVVANLYQVGKKEASFGSQFTRSATPEGKIISWDHFYSGSLPGSVCVEQPDTVKGQYRTNAQVFERGLKELKAEAFETTFSLMDSKGPGIEPLYRGEEFKPALLAFQKLHTGYAKIKGDDEKAKRLRNLFVWANVASPASGFRGTVIGKLIVDLSEGKDTEHAVSSFETMVAPTNYKRTTAPITPLMIKQTMAKIEELGLGPALERRFARLTDISIHDVLWADAGVKSVMKGGLSDLLMEHAAKSTNAEDEEKRAEEIKVDDFLKSILPTASGIEVLFKGEHTPNLISLTAPVNEDAKPLFKWKNNFAWSYVGGITDSIKERVKRAGGKVDGKLRVSLRWFNRDDLDLHIHEPAGRGMNSFSGPIYYGHMRGWTGGVLDVDMNRSGETREPVENTIWTLMPPNGPYRVVVNNYNQRETKDVGFVVEVECNGKISHFSYNKTVGNKKDVEVCTLHVAGGMIERIQPGDPGIATSNISQERWGLKTEQYAKVNAVTFSPNYWGDNAVGNKHVCFLLEGANNDEPTRGIYNEFLASYLEPHRKVFEVIGEKTKCQPTEGQLSGLGFSTTKPDNVIVKVFQGKRPRLFNVKMA